MEKHHVSIDEFFVKLSALFEAGQKADQGSIYLTQKRLTPGGGMPEDVVNTDAAFPDAEPTKPMPVLMRATDGKRGPQRTERVKLATVVQPDELGAFYARYADVCKAGMQGLKKRDRSGRKKARAKKKKDTKGEAKA